MTQRTNAYWHFQCPECGFGDAEFGHLLAADEVYCMVCLDEADLQVRLHRWTAEEAEAGQALRNAGLAAA